jgi:hypothetical protein
MRIARLPLLAAAGVFLSAIPKLSADVTYYYNSLDSNPDDFTGILTLPTYFPGAPLPIMTFSMSAVVDGETLNFTTADQAGSAEALYDTNPADPLSLLYPYPSYGIVDPVLGGQELILGPLTPGPSSLGAPLIVDVPSSPIQVDASDNGVWLQTPPTASSSVPEPSAMSVLALLFFAMAAFRTAYERRSNNRPRSAA